MNFGGTVHRYKRLLWTLALIVTSSHILAAGEQPKSIQPRVDEGFVENKGQFPSEVLFKASLSACQMWVSSNAITLDLRGDSFKSGQQIVRPSKFRSMNDELTDDIIVKHHVVRMSFENSSAPLVQSNDRLSGDRFYYSGSDQSQWVQHAAHYQSLQLQELYPGIALLLSTENGKPRYDFACAPGADPAEIRMRIDGADALSVDKDGSLRIRTSCGDVVQGGIRAYQIIEGKEQNVECRFHVEGSIATLKLASYDRSQALLIDPTIYTTFLGAEDVDVINAIRVIPSTGDVLAVGYFASAGFPKSTGAYQSSIYGAEDVFVVLYDSKLTTYRFAATVAGSSSDIAWDCAVSTDGRNTITVCGETNSTSFPTTSGVVGQTFRGAVDAFVFQLSANGDRLLYSTFYGGSDEDRAYAIAQDASGSVYFCGETKSSNLMVKAGSYRITSYGNGDGFAASLSPSGGILNYGSYLGGASRDRALDIASSGPSDANMVVVGETKSNDFNLAPFNIFNQPACAQTKINLTGVNNATDAFVSKFNSRGSDLVYSTFLGGNADDYATSVRVDVSGMAIVAGATLSTNLAIAGEFQPAKSAGIDGFVAQVKPDGSLIPYLTYLGGNGNDFIHDLEYDAGFMYLVGETFSNDLICTGDGMQQTISERGDAFIIKLRNNTVAYATYYGANQEDVLNCLALSENLGAYVGGWTSSPNIGTTDSVVQPIFGGVKDGLLTKMCFSSLQLGSPPAALSVCTGASMLISWTASQIATADPFAVELSTDDGQTWSIIKNNITTRASSWIVPVNQTPSKKCRMRVTHLATGLRVLNPGIFTIQSAPKVVSQSADVTVCRGDSMSLSVQAVGDQLSYQWRKDGVAINGATDSSYSVSSMTVSRAGSYEVVIDGACTNGVTSKPIRVTTLFAPQITSNIQNLTVYNGSAASFSVDVAGTGLQYRWQKFKVNIPGAPNSSTYTIPSTSFSDIGRYRVIVSGDCGADTSVEANLSVLTDNVGVFDDAMLNANSLQVEPNPTTGSMRIRALGLADGHYRIQLFNARGEQFIRDIEFHESEAHFNVDQCAEGVYECLVQRPSATPLQTRFVILR